MAPQYPHARKSNGDLAEQAKQAVVPDLLRPEEADRYRFMDNNRRRSPESLLNAFSYQPSLGSFTLEEELIFAEAFKDSPKDFVAIASVLPGRTSKECLQHYYANKADARFKTESRRQRELEKGPRQDMYDLEESLLDEESVVIERKDEDLDVVPILEEIKMLKRELGKRNKSFRSRGPGNSKEPALLPRPDLTLLHSSFRPPLDPSDEKLLVWMRSADVLPIIKQWKEQCLDSSELYIQMQKLLPESERPWGVITEKIADFAAHYGQREFEIKPNVKTAKAIILCTNFAAKIANCNTKLFEQFKPYGFPKLDRMRAGVSVLFTVYDDLRRHAKGFFNILLDSDLAGPISMSARKAWEQKYRFDGEDKADRRTQEDLMAEKAQTITSPYADTSCSLTTRPQHCLSRGAEKSITDTQSFENGNTAGSSDLDSEKESDISSDGIPANMGLAERALRAKADGLQIAVSTINAKLRATKEELQQNEELLATTQEELTYAHDGIRKFKEENEKLKANQRDTSM